MDLYFSLAFEGSISGNYLLNKWIGDVGNCFISNVLSLCENENLYQLVMINDFLEKIVRENLLQQANKMNEKWL